MHESEIAVIMHPDKSPSGVIGPQTYLRDIPLYSSDRIITKRQSTPVNHCVRRALESPERKEFARTGILALPVCFSESDRVVLEQLVAASVATSVGRRKRRREYFDGGRVGHPVTPDALHSFSPVLRRLVADSGILDAVHYYMSDIPRLFDIEVLETIPAAPDQDPHSDIYDKTGGVQLGRLVVIVIVSMDGPVTTEVVHQSRSLATWKRAFDNHEPLVRATDIDNCVLFDACLVHRGVRNPSDSSLFRLCLTFIQESATPEQLRCVERLLRRKSRGLSLHDPLRSV
jgi:hypothetical protein